MLNQVFENVSASKPASLGPQHHFADTMAALPDQVCLSATNPVQTLLYCFLPTHQGRQERWHPMSTLIMHANYCDGDAIILYTTQKSETTNCTFPLVTGEHHRYCSYPFKPLHSDLGPRTNYKARFIQDRKKIFRSCSVYLAATMSISFAM